jgi:hypothetical protein
MTDAMITNSTIESIKQRVNFRYQRFVIVGPLLLLAAGGGDLIFNTSGAMKEVVFNQFFDAYVAVSVFVAITLLLFFSLEKYLDIDVGTVMQDAKILQVPVATFLGLLPGCGGAVIVITSFARGKITLGAMVGALIGTMGDAAFLLMTQEPITYVKVIVLSSIAGILTGWAVDKYHPGDLYTITKVKTQGLIGKIRKRDILYIVLVFPGLIIGVMQLMQIDVRSIEIFGLDIVWLGISGIIISLVVWVVSPVTAITMTGDHPITRTTEETSFVTVWVVIAFLAYDMSRAFLGLDLTTIANSAWLYIPLLAVLIGFIPGCGPQILVTTLYLQGVIPFAGLIGNAIANDGDALFPAIALTPKMAIIATLYSSVPALIIAYFFLFYG